MKTIYKLLPIIKFILKILMVIVFVYVFYDLIKKANNIPIKVFYACFGTIILLGTLFYEYLKHIYNQMIIALTIECNHQKYNQLKEKLKKLDVFKGFKQSFIISDTLYYIDCKNGEKLLEILNENENFYRGNLDYLLIYQHSLFSAYCLLNNRTQAKKSFESLNKLRQTNQRKRKKVMKLLYNWDEIDGQAQLYIHHDPKKALTYFNNVKTSKLNPRERVLLFAKMASAYKQLNSYQQVLKYEQNIRSYNANSPYLSGIQDEKQFN